MKWLITIWKRFKIILFSSWEKKTHNFHFLFGLHYRREFWPQTISRWEAVLCLAEKWHLLFGWLVLLVSGDIYILISRVQLLGNCDAWCTLSLMVFSFLARKEDPLKPYLHSILPMLLACSSLSHPLRPCLEYWYNKNFIKYNTASYTDSTKSNLLQTSQHGLGSS